MNQEQLKQELKKAADGLLMLSETEEAIECFFHEKPDHEPFTPDLVVKWAGKPAGKKVEVQELDYFFRNMVREDPDEGPQQHEQAARFRNLVATLKELLQDVKVYKIDEIGVDVYILGRTPDGDYAGYKTIVVET
ncbi:nuclease A inhibitor family protein [Botryobacter ruber]|uniref:nuclease A inhibitor family protein n=1 Tax=Botryobacter ruber TaxID=2171629 RepID=UPI000E0AB8E1|nr:nuclease A inhibitor family protein [Botryobacter ruber]